MLRIIKSPEAENDLDEIWPYINKANHPAISVSDKKITIVKVFSRLAGIF